MSTKNETKRVQADVNKEVANEAELIMSEIGITPTVVINALYKKLLRLVRFHLALV